MQEALGPVQGEQETPEVAVGPSEGNGIRPQDFTADRNVNLDPLLLNSLWVSIKGQKGRREMAAPEKETTKINIL